MDMQQFLFQCPRFLINQKNVDSNSSPGHRITENGSQSKENDFFPSTEKKIYKAEVSEKNKSKY